MDIVTTRGFIAEQSLLIENMLKALMESLAYLIAPKNEAAVVELIMRNYASKTLSPLKKATMRQCEPWPAGPIPRSTECAMYSVC